MQVGKLVGFESQMVVCMDAACLPVRVLFSRNAAVAVLTHNTAAGLKCHLMQGGDIDVGGRLCCVVGVPDIAANFAVTDIMLYHFPL